MCFTALQLPLSVFLVHCVASCLVVTCNATNLYLTWYFVSILALDRKWSMHLCCNAQQSHNSTIQWQSEQILYSEGKSHLRFWVLKQNNSYVTKKLAMSFLCKQMQCLTCSCLLVWHQRSLTRLCHTPNDPSLYLSGDWNARAVQLYPLHQLQHHHWYQ